jgi:glycosyltransferase involved in cell wall biosynthesis
MLTHSYYEEDPRVRREAEAVAASGRPVDVYALRQEDAEPTAKLHGVTVRRLDVQRHQGAGIATYAVEYLDFFVRALFALTSAHPRRRYALVQVHTIPDGLVFATLPLRFAGIPVVLDLHEAMPEFFRVRFPGLSNPAAHGILAFQERLSVGFADAAITVNDALAERLVNLGVPRSKVTVVRNSPSLERFDPGRHERRSFMADGRLRIVYAGALSPVYELDVAIDALARIRRDRPDLGATLELYGRDFEEVPLHELAADSGVSDAVAFHGRIAIEDVPAAIAAADIGVAPTRRTAMTDFSLSTKIFEYAAMSKPVVASRLPMVERTFRTGSVATYEPGDAGHLAAQILGLVDEPLEREARIARTADRVRELSWERESVRYLGLVERLARDGLSSARTPQEGS